MKRGMCWPIAMAVILAITVGANFWVMVIANDDPSFAIEKDYYAKAVNWDAEMAQESRNQSLGWHVEPSLAPFTRDRGALLRVQLVDARGAPITGATIKVAALFNARAGDVYEATLAPSTSGYSASLPVRHQGQWELRFDATRGSDHFTATARLEAVAARVHGS